MMRAALTAAALLACVGSAAAGFCTDYSLSACAGTPFHATHSCSAHFGMISVAQQSCVIYHLKFVDGNTSAHCAHARGEGPCAPGGTMQPPPPRKVSGASSAAASGGAVALAAWLVL